MRNFEWQRKKHIDQVWWYNKNKNDFRVIKIIQSENGQTNDLNISKKKKKKWSDDQWNTITHLLMCSIGHKLAIRRNEMPSETNSHSKDYLQICEDNETRKKLCQLKMKLIWDFLTKRKRFIFFLLILRIFGSLSLSSPFPKKKTPEIRNV